MTEIQRFSLSYEIESAVADAILFAISDSVRKALKIFEPTEIKDLSKMVEEATARKCFLNSEFAATFLIERYPNLWKRMFIVEAKTDNKTSFRRGNWKSHSGLIFEDILKKWHYITPANSDAKVERAHNPLLTHEERGSLAELLHRIDELETNPQIQVWPTETEILAELEKRENNQFAVVRPKMQNLIVITMKNGKKNHNCTSSLSNLNVLRWHLFS